MTLLEAAAEDRWHVRAHSIREAVELLDGVWTRAAHEVEARGPSDNERQWALGDPRLASHLEASGSIRVRMRTSVLTLVVVAPRPETAERAMAVINALAQRHPSRAIVVSPGDFDGPASTDAHIYAACKLADRSDAEVCTEQILVRTGGETSQHLARVVTPLLIHDLPVVLWWADDPPFETRQFGELVAVADRLLVDSGSFGGDGLERLAGLSATAQRGVAVADVGWLRLSLWRELLAGLFDHPLLTGELGNIRSVRIDVAQPAQAVRLAKAAYVCGWLAAMLGWEVLEPLHAVDDGASFAASFRRRRNKIEVSVRPVRKSLDGNIRAAGSLVRVEVEAERPRTAIRARVTRQHDHLLATADWNGAPVCRRAARLEPFDEAPFVAEALERPGHDRIYERSLLRAVRCSGRGEA